MLTLRRLELVNFGPFKDHQVLEFPTDPGVTVVYGENMRGKSTLLNAIRYAFLGRVIGRGSKDKSLHVVGNWDKAREGEYGFEVHLVFDFDGATYELLRRCRPRADVKIPTTDADYSQTVQVRREGKGVLTPDERDRLLAQALPEEVARFFLFDGELLQQYEELLTPDSTTGAKITDAIERILGVPVLKRGRAHFRELLEDAQSKYAKSAQRNDDAQQLGAKLLQLTQIRANHIKVIQEKEDELKVERRDKEELGAYLSSQKRFEDLMAERSKAVARLEQLEEESKQKRSRLKELLLHGWRTLVQPQVRAARQEAQAQVKEAVESEAHRLREHALQTGTCSTCERVLDDPTRRNIQALVAKRKDPSLSAKEAFARLDRVERIETADVSDQVRDVEQRLDEITVEVASLKDRVDDLDVLLKESDPDAIAHKRRTWEAVTKKVFVLERGIEAEKAEVVRLDGVIRELQKKVDAKGGADIRAAQRRRDLYQNLQNLFEEAIAAYREKVKQRVEASASQLFRSMTTEPEYGGLTINTSFGLTIVHQDGRPLPERSAGAEHVVALSLMGALQQNAPLQGPIVMDSPFGRLDQGHRMKVVSILPQLAKQVVLLVYEQEIGRGLARELLGEHLLREYTLVRRSATHTILQRGVER